jgi:hypothetical protein
VRDRIVNILFDFAKKHRIAASKVIIELFADELIKHGVVLVTKCGDCKHLTEDGFCYKDVEGVSYKKTHKEGYCDKGEK